MKIEIIYDWGQIVSISQVAEDREVGIGLVSIGVVEVDEETGNRWLAAQEAYSKAAMEADAVLVEWELKNRHG